MKQKDIDRLAELEAKDLLDEREFAEYEFLKKKKENDARIEQFRENQKAPYTDKRSRAVNLAWEFFRDPEIDGQCYVAVGGLDSITLYLFLRSIGIDVPAVSVSSLEDKSIQKIHHALGVRRLKSLRTKTEVIKEFGWPVISKEVAGKIDTLQHPTEQNATVRHAIITGETGAPVSDPVNTIRSAGGQVLSAANLIQYHTEQSEKVRGQGMGDPIMTVDSANRYGLASAQLVEYYGNGNPLDVSQPMHTVTAHDREALVMAHVSEFRSASIGRDAREPAGTITSHDHEGVVSAHVQKFFGGVVGSEATEPLPTVTAVDHNALCAAHMVKFKAQELGTSPAEPLPTITAQSAAGGFAECRAVLVKANSRENLGNWPKIRELLNEHCGYNLADDEVILLIINGLAYYIADITLRMLTPRELYNAMGFPPDYIIDRDYMGNSYKKSKQVARCGNAVCPPLAEAMVRANLPEWCGKKFHTMAEWEDAVAS